MAVQIPPWLSIDPTAPAKIALAANQRKSQEAIAARRAQFEEQQLMAQQEMMYARLAAQERADQRRQQVYQQTHDAALAQQASAAEFRRQIAQQQNDRQMQALRLREQQVEQQTGIASRKLLGTQNFQRDVQSGMSVVDALTKNAPEMLADHPERIFGAITAAKRGAPPEAFDVGGMKGIYNPATGAPTFPPAGATPLGPEAYLAQDILDAQGKPTGLKAIPGRTGAKVLNPTRSQLTPTDQIRSLTSEERILSKKLKDAIDPKEEARIQKDLDGVLGELRALRKGTAVPERAAGKLDEGIATPESQQDFILPPTDMGAEGEPGAEGELNADEQAMLDEQPQDQTDLTDEEQAALDEGM